MAWGQKYQLGFEDLKGIYWIAKFFKDGWVGDVITLRGSGTPATYELLNESDHVFDPIKETQVIFSIVVEDTHILRDLCSEGDMTTYVELFQDEYSSAADPYWVGYVDASQYEEPYDVFPYEVNVTCIDGLKLLRSILYDTYQDSFDYDRASEESIILDVLSNIGYTEFKEFVNLYEEEMDSGIDKSPIDQTLLDQNVFTERYSIEVLQQILLKYNACIRQKDGVFCIYRPKEIIDQTVWGRHFIASDTKTAISYTPTQYISRTGLHVSSLKQVPGGRIISQYPVRTVKLTQDYGYKDSWIKNWQFKGITFDENTNMFDDWTYSSGGVLRVLHQFKGEGDGIVLPASTSGPGVNPILYQVFGFYAKVTSNLFVIEFEYFTASEVDAQNVSVKVRIKADGANKYLYPIDDNEAGWNDTVDYLDPTEALTGGQIGEWKTYKRYFTGLPVAGSYTIGLYRGTSSVSNAFWGIKNIKFYSTSDAMSIKRTPKPSWFEVLMFGKLRAKEREEKKHPSNFEYFDVEEIATKQYTAINSDVETGEFKQEHILGDITDANIDNIIDQFRGSLIISIRETLAQAATNFDADHSADYSDGGVTVGHSGNDIIFTAATAGIDFTGNTTITNTSGNLSGTVVNTQANVALEAEWQPDFYYEVNNKCSNGGVNYICISAHFNQEPPNATYWDLTDQPQARIDTITLTGTEGIPGSANILCDGETQEVVINKTTQPSVSWWKRMEETSYDLESSGNLKELLELIKEEIAEQYSRTKYLLNVPIQEITQNEITTLNVIGNIQDDYNVDESIFNIRNVDSWSKSNCLLTFQDGQVQIDKILLTGFNGACEFGTELGVKEVLFTTDLETTAAKYVTDYAADLLSVNGIVVGYEVTGSNVYLVFVASVPGTGFTTVVHRTGGSLDGTIINLTPNATTSTKNYATYITTGIDSSITKSGLKLKGSVCRYINIKYKIISGNWTSGQIFYSTVSHGRSSSFQKNLSLTNDNQWHVELIDMGDLDVGGTDWLESFITGIWFDLTDETPVVILIDWIGFNRIFTINRGSFVIHNRRWNLDLMEIIR